MTLDDLPPTRRRPRVAFTWWWVAALAVAAAAYGAFEMMEHPRRAPAEQNVIELSHTPPG